MSIASASAYWERYQAEEKRKVEERKTRPEECPKCKRRIVRQVSGKLAWHFCTDNVQRAKCRYCGQEARVLKDGRMESHRVGTDWCSGAYETKEEQGEAIPASTQLAKLLQPLLRTRPCECGANGWSMLELQVGTSVSGSTILGLTWRCQNCERRSVERVDMTKMLRREGTEES